jgi:hydrogenase expression/formation protein HypE
MFHVRWFTVIKLEHGAGGESMNRLIDFIRSNLSGGGWSGLRDDSAYIKYGKKFLAFTTDSFTVKPLFFRGGDIGKLSVAGTINDLAVMGADPTALSLSIVVEEGFGDDEFSRIMKSVGREGRKVGVPVVTGDTKVMGSGEIDGIVLNTSGVGVAERILDENPSAGDVVIASAPVGDHEASLLALRFNYKTGLKSDCRSLLDELKSVGNLIKTAKDPTRGGLAAALHEITVKSKARIRFMEDDVPVKPATKSIAGFLGLEPIYMACEGVFICVASEKNGRIVLNLLRKFNPKASVIGVVEEVDCSPEVVLETSIGGLRRIRPADGTLNPRIC